MAKFLVRWRGVVWRSAEVATKEEDAACDIARETVDRILFGRKSSVSSTALKG